MPTRSGWLLLIGSAASLAAGRLFAVVELFVLGAIGLCLLALALGWVWRATPTLAISRRIAPPRVSVGGIGRVEVQVTNRGDRPAAFLTAVDPVEHTVGARLELGRLGAGASAEVGYRIPTTRRGLLHIGPLVVQHTDPFGLARRFQAGAEEATVTILPAVDELTAVPAGSGRHEPLAGVAPRSRATSGLDDLATLRPYVVGDDLRRVHWPSTARADELQVRRDEEPWQGHLTVVLDCRSGALDPDRFERAVSAAAGLVHAVAEAGDRVRLVLTDGTDSAMVDGRRASGALLESLALAAQHDEAEVVLPLPDPRGAEPAIVVSGGGEPGPLADLLRGDGYGPLTVVCFDADPPPTSDHADVVWVAPGDTFAAAWARR